MSGKERLESCWNWKSERHQSSNCWLPYLGYWINRSWQDGTHLAQRLQTSQAWSGTQNVPGLHLHLVSAVVVQWSISISSAEKKKVDTSNELRRCSDFKSTKENALKMLKLKSRKSIFSSHAKKPKNKKWKMWLGIVKFRGCSFPAQTLKPRFNLWTLFFLRPQEWGQRWSHSAHKSQLWARQL